MSTAWMVTLAIVGIAGALARALLLDEIKGRLGRRARTDVERTIASLPPALQEEWAEEWRSEFEAVKDMPLERVRFARGLRRSANDLTAALEPAAAAPARRRPTSRAQGEVGRPPAGRFTADVQRRLGRAASHVRNYTQGDRRFREPILRSGRSVLRLYGRALRHSSNLISSAVRGLLTSLRSPVPTVTKLFLLGITTVVTVVEIARAVAPVLGSLPTSLLLALAVLVGSMVYTGWRG